MYNCLVDVTSIDTRSAEKEQATTYQVLYLKNAFRNSTDYKTIQELVNIYTHKSHNDSSQMTVQRPSPPNVFRILLLLIQ